VSEGQKQWFRQRVGAIHETVSVYDALRHHGVDLQQATDDREEQFSCPFHGEDNKPSARVYPTRDDSHSHAWCFVCQEPGWDAIGLWQKFNNITFGQALRRIEQEFGLETPERADGSFEPNQRADNSEAFKKLYLACEVRLLGSKRVYQLQNDMKGYLNAGSLLDRTKYRVDSEAWSPERGMDLLQQLLARILDKTTSCPVG